MNDTLKDVIPVAGTGKRLFPHTFTNPNTKKVSVIVPTYNRKDTISETINSVLNQTYQGFEIVIIDDGSNDNTWKNIKKFNNDKIKYIYQKHSGLPSKARNTGIKVATGEYIAFLDSDDVWLPTKLELQMKFLESNPEIDIAYSNAMIIDEYGKRKGILINSTRAKSGRIFLELVNDSFVPILTVLMKKKVFETIGSFNEDLSMRAAEDYEYWLRASLKFNFGYIDTPLALYRVHSGCVSLAINRPLLIQKVLQSFFVSSEVQQKYYNNIIYKIERLDANVADYYWSISDKINAKVYAKRYFLSNLKRLKLFNFVIGVLFYVSINFSYNSFKGIIRIVARIRKPLSF